jgi:hypothetical protein
MSHAITAVEEVTPQWLTDILLRNGHLSSGAVRSVEISGVHDQQLHSVSYFLAVTYTPNTPASAPAHLYLKLPRLHSAPGHVAQAGERQETCWLDYRRVVAEHVLYPMRLWMAGLPDDFWSLFIQPARAGFHDLTCAEILEG